MLKGNRRYGLEESVKDLKASELSQEKWNIKKLKDGREGEAFWGSECVVFH